MLNNGVMLRDFTWVRVRLFLTTEDGLFMDTFTDEGLLKVKLEGEET